MSARFSGCYSCVERGPAKATLYAQLKMLPRLFGDKWSRAYRHLGEPKTQHELTLNEAAIHDNRIGGDAGQLSLPAQFADALGLHCSLEHFEGDTDIRFIGEAGRVRKPGENQA